MEKMLKQFVSKVKEYNDDERTLTHYITTEAVDRMGEVIKLDGWKMENFRKNPVVLFAHDYYGPAVGKSLWQKTDSKGILAKTQFAPTALGGELYMLYREGYMQAWSVGFHPVKWEDGDGKETPRRTFVEQELLEYSAVAVPANPEALQNAYDEGKMKTKILQDAFSGVIKIVQKDTKYTCECIECGYKTESEEHCKDLKCPECGSQMRREERPGPGQEGAKEPGSKSTTSPKEISKDPEDAEWDADEETKEAEIADLKIIYAWWNPDKPDLKGSFKLLHHRAKDNHNVVWKGVYEAMATLLGARGKVDIPEKDRKDVYDHLSEHYDQFGKMAPELKEYGELELKELFPGMFKETKPDEFDSLKEFRPAFNSERPKTSQGRIVGIGDCPECGKKIKILVSKEVVDFSAGLGAAAPAEEEEGHRSKDPEPEKDKDKKTVIRIKTSDDASASADKDGSQKQPDQPGLGISAEEASKVIKETISGEIRRITGKVN